MRFGEDTHGLGDLVLRYAIAILSAMAVVSLLLIFPALTRAPFLLGLLAVLLLTMYAGLGPGLVASVLSAFGILYFVMPPLGSLETSLADTVLLVLFLLCSIIIALLTAERDQQRKSAQIRAEHLANLSELAHRSLISTNIRGPMEHAASIIAKCLGLENTFVAERLPQEGSLLITAGEGWNEGTVGRAILSAEPGSLAAVTMLAREPIVVRDLSTEVRFSPCSLLSAHHLSSGATVMVRGSTGPFGILGAFTPRKRVLSDQDVYFVQATADILGAAIQRHQGEEQLRQLNAQLEKRVAERTAQLETANAGLSREVAERQQREEQIRLLNRDLEQQAAELQAMNQELEAFSYSVSHDLRTPVSSIREMSRIVADESADVLPGFLKTYLHLIEENATAMDRLIQDLLSLSRATHLPLKKETLRPSDQVRQVFAELRRGEPERKVELVMGELPASDGDSGLMRQVWVNLLSNALKFTRRRTPAHIEVGSVVRDGKVTYFVKDDGVGFDSAHADKLFGTFQRFHAEEDYEGTGIGLAVVQRIIRRHGGTIWADAEEDKGATFFFTMT